MQARAFARGLALLVRPVPGEKRRRLAAQWRELDPRWRGPLQGFGRQSTGCGATLGLMPRCDFDCHGCYLGVGANGVPRFSRAEISAQLVALRRHLGPKGNLQLTDGEVTLLPEAELLSVVAEARRLGLIPMVMTHGDTFRRAPDLLRRLVLAGLTEVAIHVDSLQVGRRGSYAGARSEAALEPLRDELAELVRRTRRQTGIRLRAAATLTIARSNLAEVPLVMAGMLRRCDTFGLVSLQPLALVGRTREGSGGVGVDELWSEIGRALAPHGFDSTLPSPLRFGHPACSRVEPMLVLERHDEPLRLLPIVRPGNATDERIAARFLASDLAGLAFRDDSPLERFCRGLGALGRAPVLVLGALLPWARERARDAGTTLCELAWDLGRGRARLGSFQVVTHHFMSPAEASSELGKERLAACVFRVPAEGRMVPMCEANALGARERVYAAQGARLSH